MNQFNEDVLKIKNEIEEFPLEIDKGTKRMIAKYHKNQVELRNKLVNKYIKKYTKFREDVVNELRFRQENMQPKCEIKKEEIDEQNNVFLDDLLFLKRKNLMNKLKFSYYLNLMLESKDDLHKVNENIKELLNIFRKADIKITKDDFKYTAFSYEYMKVFLDNINSDKFDAVIKEIFDKIYWACPNLLLHLKFAFLNLFSVNEKNFKLYVKNKENSIIKTNNLINKDAEKEYGYLIESTDKLYNSDEYILTNDFFNNTFSPDDYIKGSNNRNNRISKFLKDGDVDSLEDPLKYFNNVISLNHVLKELNNYLFFKPFVDDVNKRIESYDKKQFKVLYKEYKKLENSLSKLKTSIFRTMMKGKKVLQKDIVKENDLVNEISLKYDEMMNAYINNEVNSRISSVSNIKESLTEYILNYDYFVISFNKINNEDLNWNIDVVYKKMINFIYNPYNQFIKNTTITSKESIYEIIASKFKLLKLNINAELIEETLVELISDSDYIAKVYFIENLGLDFKTYSTINKIKKIKG